MKTNAPHQSPLTPDAEDSLIRFQNYLELHDKAANTIRAYLYAVRQFMELYSTANHDNLMLYKCYLIDRYKPQTVNLRIRALNCYLEFLHISAERILMVRLQQKSFLENVISQADYEYLKCCLLRDGKLLCYFAVRLMAATGVRISELVELQVEDIKRGCLDLHSKGDRIRRVYIPHTVQAACLLWLDNIGRSTGYVFLNRFGNKITPTGIRSQLKQAAMNYDLDPAVVHPHSFRHLFAKNFVERCDDIALLSDILGHESIETTRIYLHRSSSEQQQMFNQIVNW